MVFMWQHKNHIYLNASKIRSQTIVNQKNKTSICFVVHFPLWTLMLIIKIISKNLFK